jgi:hypothetical protein
LAAGRKAGPECRVPEARTSGPVAPIGACSLRPL